ncbi:MAG: hypothetical protein MJ239_05890 [Bacilli bacterium]|nr:hypothetical protein [Bacilli bacterium]
MKKWVSRTIDGVLGVIIAFLIFCQVSMTVTASKNYGVPSVFGMSFLYVATDSMEGENPDSLPTGTGAFCKKVPVEDIVVGDVITFYYPHLGAPDTHRVLEIETDPAGKRVFKTRGDNLHAWSCPVSGCPETPWETIPEKYYIGKIIGHNDAFGKFLTIVSPQAAGSAGKVAWFMPVAVITPIVIFVGIYIGQSVKKYRAETKAERDALMADMIAAGIDPNDEAKALLFEEKWYIKREVKEEMERAKAEEKAKIQKEMEKFKAEEKARIKKEMAEAAKKGEKNE